MTVTPARYWHGGIPGLRPGDLIQPGHQRPAVDGCPVCAARNAGQVAVINGEPIDGPSAHTDGVYLTEDREYARFYASLYGRGDLYRVEAVGEARPSEEDRFPTVIAPAARVLAAYDRAVLLTPTQRRALNRRWTELDRLAEGASA